MSILSGKLAGKEEKKMRPSRSSRTYRSLGALILVLSYALVGSIVPGQSFIGGVAGLGTPVSIAHASSTPTPALAASVNGEVPALATFGGSDPSSPGVSSATIGAASGVNPETGDLTESNTDLSLPSFGPGLDFTRTYDSLLAQQQAATGASGLLGYGWSNSTGSGLSLNRPVPGWMYRSAGPSGTGSGDSMNGVVATGADFNSPSGVAVDSEGNLFMADTANSRVVMVAAGYRNPFLSGSLLVPGDAYTVAGSWSGATGSCNAQVATGACLNLPHGVAIDPSGNLLIADTSNNTVDLVAATSTDPLHSGTMTVDDIYVVAGTGVSGAPTSGVAATSSKLNAVQGVTADSVGNLYIADTLNQVVETVYAGVSTPFRSSPTLRDIYVIVGNGTPGSTGDGGAATSGLLHSPTGVAVDASTNLYVSDELNSRVQEEAAITHVQWGQSETLLDVYTVVGTTGSTGISANGTAASSAKLDDNFGIAVDSSNNLYIADSGDHELEAARGRGK
jgi:Domain of unknown function (DUF6531)/NHL repeat